MSRRIRQLTDGVKMAYNSICAYTLVRAARRTERRNGPVENAAVDIVGNVDIQIDVDFDLSSDNELLEEVVRAPHGRVIPPAVTAPLTMDTGLECMRKINPTRFYVMPHWRIRLDFTRLVLHALRLRLFRDTLISNSSEAISSNPIHIEVFLYQE